ncbi:hypothetical protein Tcan_00804, partial [Toxocara canis]
ICTHHSPKSLLHYSSKHRSVQEGTAQMHFWQTMILLHTNCESSRHLLQKISRRRQYRKREKDRGSTGNRSNAKSESILPHDANLLQLSYNHFKNYLIVSV